MTSEELIAQIQSSDPDIRTKAWLSAGDVGSPALRSLAQLAVEGELEVGRAAKRAIWQIVRTSGALKFTDDRRRNVIKELVALLDNGQPVELRREVLWMLSEIGSDPGEIKAIAALLGNPDLREDARCALERIPGAKEKSAVSASN